MQYGVEVAPYQRVSKANNDVKKNIDVKLVKIMLVYFVTSLLISRVVLVNSMAPFGLAFLVAVLAHWENKTSLAAGCGALIGYATLYNNTGSIGAYLALVVTITFLSYMLPKVSSGKKLIYLFIVIFVEFLAFKYLILKFAFPISLVAAFLKLYVSSQYIILLIIL